MVLAPDRWMLAHRDRSARPIQRCAGLFHEARDQAMLGARVASGAHHRRLTRGRLEMDPERQISFGQPQQIAARRLRRGRPRRRYEPMMRVILLSEPRDPSALPCIPLR